MVCIINHIRYCSSTQMWFPLWLSPSSEGLSRLLQLSGGVDWRKKLDSQRGAVLATELKNNSCKIAKWAMAAILAGSHFIKFG